MKRNFFPLSITGNPLYPHPELNSNLATSQFSLQIAIQLDKTAHIINKPHGTILWTFASSQFFVRAHNKSLNSNSIKTLGKPYGLQTGDFHALGILLQTPLLHSTETKTPVFNLVQFDSRVLLPLLDAGAVEKERKKLRQQYGLTSDQEFTPLSDAMQKEIVIRFIITTLPQPDCQRVACADISLFDLLQTSKSMNERQYHIRESTAQLNQSLARGSSPFLNDLRTWPLTKKLDPTSAKHGTLFVRSTLHSHVPPFESIVSKHNIVFRPIVLIDMLKNHSEAVRENDKAFQRDLSLLQTVLTKFLDYCYIPHNIHPTEFVTDLLSPVFNKYNQDQPNILHPLIERDKQYVDQHFKRFPLSQGQNVFQSIEPSGIPLWFTNCIVPHTHVPDQIHDMYSQVCGEHSELIPNPLISGHPESFKQIDLCNGILPQGIITSSGYSPALMRPIRPILDPMSTEQHGLSYQCFFYDARHLMFGDYNNHIKYLQQTEQHANILSIPPPTDFPPDLTSLINLVQHALSFIQPSDAEPSTVYGQGHVRSSYYHGITIAHFISQEILHRTLIQMKSDLEKGIIQYYTIFTLSYRMDASLNAILPALLSLLPISFIVIANDTRDTKCTDSHNIFKLDPLWCKLDTNLNSQFGPRAGSPGAIPDHDSSSSSNNNNDSGDKESATVQYKRQQKYAEYLFKEPNLELHSNLYSKIIGSTNYLGSDPRHEMSNSKSLQNPQHHLLQLDPTQLTAQPSSNSNNYNNGLLSSMSYEDPSSNQLSGVTSPSHSTHNSTPHPTPTSKKDKSNHKDKKDEEVDLFSFEKQLKEDQSTWLRQLLFRDCEENLFSLIKPSLGTQRDMFILYIDSHCFEGFRQRFPSLSNEQLEEMKQKEICEYLQQRLTLQVRDWFNLHYRIIDLYQQYSNLSTAYPQHFTPSATTLQQQQQCTQGLSRYQTLSNEATPLVPNMSFLSPPSQSFKFQASQSNLHPSPSNPSNHGSPIDLSSTTSGNNNANNDKKAKKASLWSKAKFQLVGGKKKEVGAIAGTVHEDNDSLSPEITLNPVLAHSVQPTVSNSHNIQFYTGGGDTSDDDVVISSNDDSQEFALRTQPPRDPTITLPQSPLISDQLIQKSTLSSTNVAHTGAEQQPTEAFAFSPSLSFSRYSDEEDDEFSSSTRIVPPNSSTHTTPIKPQPTIPSSSLAPPALPPLPCSPAPPVLPPRNNRAPPPMPPKLHPITARLDPSLISPDHIHCGFDNSYLSTHIKNAYPTRINNACQTSDFSLLYNSLWQKAKEQAALLYQADDLQFQHWIEQKHQQIAQHNPQQ